MPMTKKRRRMDKNKRRCLFGIEKKSNVVEPVTDPVIENTTLEKPIKKMKNEQVVDIKIENKSIDENILIEESKPKRQSLDKSTVKDEIEQPVKKISEDIEKKVTPRIEQRYFMI